MGKSNRPNKPRNCDSKKTKRKRPTDEYEPPPHISDCWDQLVEDDNYNSELEGEASALVLAEFSKIKKNYESTVLKDARNKFVEERRRFYPSRIGYETSDGSEPLQLSFVDLVAQTYSERGVTVTKPAPTRVVIKSRFDSSPALPRMRYWIHSERNIETIDNPRLSHIPHISDKMDDRNFVSELREVYTEGIHGADEGNGEYINDFMMYQLLTITMQKWKKGLSYLHAAVFKLFPNKYSFKELQDHAYLTLKERFDPSPPMKTDEADDELNSITTMLCVQCPEYDCTLHASTELDPHIKDRQKIGNQVIPEEACGKTCFKKSPQRRSVGVEFNSEVMLQNLRTLIKAQNFNVCKLTSMFRIMCEELGMKALSCAELNRVIEQLRQENIALRAELPSKKVKKLSKSERYKQFRRFRSSLANNNRMEPCSHSGPCQKRDDCYCFVNNLACSKYCKCSDDCAIKFPGCSCGAGFCGNQHCPCTKGGWECDPDTCSSCNCDVVNPLRSKDGRDLPFCSNIFIQVGAKKDIDIGISSVAGWGCFIRVPAEKGELISEYTGEIISNDEAERRGRICDESTCSYVFGLSGEKSIDAGRMGNIIRFANHSGTNPNCEAKIVIINGDQRIGLYASRRIEEGEELFFNYGYKEFRKHNWDG
ncbi:unnamed protein product [Auanema sp. JU1783]|nr:unnamed protein product [Auanema sp. JU1783]